MHTNCLSKLIWIDSCAAGYTHIYSQFYFKNSPTKKQLKIVALLKVQAQEFLRTQIFFFIKAHFFFFLEIYNVFKRKCKKKFLISCQNWTLIAKQMEDEFKSNVVINLKSVSVLVKKVWGPQFSNPFLCVYVFLVTAQFFKSNATFMYAQHLRRSNEVFDCGRIWQKLYKIMQIFYKISV